MEWKTTWSYLPIEYNTTIGIVENLTQRTYIKNVLSGNKIKLKFSNRYSPKPLIMEKVVIGKRKEKSNKIENCIQVTYKGENRIELEPFQEFYSDELAFEIEAGTWIELSIYVKGRTEICSACSTWSAKSWNTVYGIKGDHTMEEKFAEKESCEIYPYVNADVNKANIIFGVCEIRLFTEERVKTVALFGDSITHMSYYSDALIERVGREMKGKVAFINCGIGGNCILNDATHVADMPGSGSCFGRAAVKRFEEDVCGSADVDAVIILAGINDILHPFIFGYPQKIVTAEQLALGMEQLFKIAHRHGMEVYVGTVMPFRCDEMEWIPEGEEVRNQFNEWIRKQKITEGIVDFANVTEKKENPEYMQDMYHIGDGLHPGSDGGRVMAEAIPASWFL